MDTELSKLRRFALAIGLVLFLYSIAGVRLASPATITPLGIPLVITNPGVFEWGLVVASIYGALRYWYYGYVKNVSPSKARRLLFNGEYKVTDAWQMSEVASRYLPGMEHYVSIVKTTLNEKWAGAAGAEKLKGAARFWVPLDMVDFTAPIWLNAMPSLSFFFDIGRGFPNGSRRIPANGREEPQRVPGALWPGE